MKEEERRMKAEKSYESETETEGTPRGGTEEDKILH